LRSWKLQNVEVAELGLAFHQRPLNAVAWISRNLIELAIWTIYCVESPENAKRFSDDCARDATDILSKVPKGMSKDPDFDFKAARDEIVQRAEAKGAEGLIGPFERVAKAAAETLSHSEQFFWMNKVLSKFAHPTALWVMMSPEQLVECVTQIAH